MQHPAYGAFRRVTSWASVLVAHNPSPMTLEGTNTWVLGSATTSSVVIDPGPADLDHLHLLAERGPVRLVLLTHHHPDHAEGAAKFAEVTGAPVRAWDPQLCSGAEPLRDGDVLDPAELGLRVLHTPGHTRDSVSFVADRGREPAVLAGDTILGRGTTVVAHPDGHLSSYLRSLRRLAELPVGTRVLPGHGPELPDVSAIAADYLDHRQQRLDQVRQVVREQGPEVTARQVVETVYADVDRAVWPAAEWSVRAQLTYLSEAGEL